HGLGADDPTWLMTRLKGWFGKKQPQVQRASPGASQTPELLAAAAPRPDFAQTPAGRKAAAGVRRGIAGEDAEFMAGIQEKLQAKQREALHAAGVKLNLTPEQL